MSYFFFFCFYRKEGLPDCYHIVIATLEHISGEYGLPPVIGTFADEEYSDNGISIQIDDESKGLTGKNPVVLHSIVLHKYNRFTCVNFRTKTTNFFGERSIRK